MSESSFSQDVLHATGGWGPRLLVAHRGASAIEAENTLAAFERAISAGANAIEFDVRLTADGHPVVMHDPQVDRTTDGHGLVRDLTLAQMKRLRIVTSDGDVAEVPTLTEALTCCLGRVTVDIELKNIPGEADFEPDGQGVAEATVRALEEAGGSASAIVSSFNPWALGRVRDSAPTIVTGLLTNHEVEAAAGLAFAQERGFGWILPVVRQLRAADPGFVAEAHRAGISVGTWITDVPAEVVALFRSGVDAVATNDPEAVMPAVREAYGS
jgi:glycerophosphoryl diester phosphodiesterase